MAFGRFPVLKSYHLGNKRYRLKLGVTQYDLTAEMIAQDPKLRENYIDNRSFILDVRPDEDKNIYDFFYGSYIDELKDILPNGNHVYLRTIKDKYGNPKTVYRMTLDFATKTTEGFPNIEYEKIN